MPPPRIFIDSSVFFAAALSTTGAGRELFAQQRLGRCVLVLTDYVLEETRRNLRLKATKAVEDLEALLAESGLEVVAMPTNDEVLAAAHVVELKDAPIVAGALSSHADYLVSYDTKHLVSQAGMIKEAFGLDVLVPGDVLRVIRQQASEG